MSENKPETASPTFIDPRLIDHDETLRCLDKACEHTQWAFSRSLAMDMQEIAYILQAALMKLNEGRERAFKAFLARAAEISEGAGDNAASEKRA